MEPTTGRGLIGLYEFANDASRNRDLNAEIASYRPQEFPCVYNPSTGQTECWRNCVTAESDLVECPERSVENARRERSRRNLRRFLKLAFSYPSLEVTNGLLDDTDVVTSHQ